jgi:hypothetical protein
MRRTSEILNTISPNIGLRRPGPLAKIQNDWVQLVGQVVAKHTFAFFLRDHVLYLKVDTPQWLHHLSYIKHDILSQLETFEVAELKLCIGKIPPCRELNNAVETRELTDEERAFIQKTLEAIKDHDLKKAFENYLTKAMSIVRKDSRQ